MQQSSYISELRHNKELEAFIDEESTVVDKQTLLELYQTTTSAPDFPMQNKTTNSGHEMFCQYCAQRLKNTKRLIYDSFSEMIIKLIRTHQIILYVLIFQCLILCINLFLLLLDNLT